MSKIAGIVIVVSVIFVVFVIGLYKYIYDIAPNAEYKSGVGFDRVCNGLNNKEFNFENLASLSGFTDLNGRISLNLNDIENFKENSTLRIYKTEWFQGPNIKYSWVCEIKTFDNKIQSSSHFYLTD